MPLTIADTVSPSREGTWEKASHTQDIIRKWSSHHSIRLLVSLQYTRKEMNTRARPTKVHDVPTSVGPRSSWGSAANSSGVRTGKPSSGGCTSILVPMNRKMCGHSQSLLLWCLERKTVDYV